MLSIGLVSFDVDDRWIGGRYYLQHLIKTVSALPYSERLPISDVWWQHKPTIDPFAEVRTRLESQAVVGPPSAMIARIRRKIRRTIKHVNDSRDLFQEVNIGVLFPILPCDAPGVPYVFWLTDFQYKHMPHLFDETLTKWFTEQFDSNVSKADLVVLSSNHALRDFRQFYPNHVAKARVVHFCSVPEENWQELNPQDVAQKHGIHGPYFIISNQFSLHKNHLIVFEAVRILKERGIKVQVVCTGNTFCFQNEEYFSSIEAFIREYDLKDSVSILGMIPRLEQIALLRGAIAMLQPSRFEGWSTAVEDAKTLGKILLVSDIEVHREQLGEDHSLYVNVDDAQAWANAIRETSLRATPNPDIEAEAIARKQLAIRQLSYGRDFIAVMREAMSIRK